MGGEIFDPLRIIAGLRARGVPFVLTGDLAAMVHGAELTPSRVEVYLDGEDGSIERVGMVLTPSGAERVDTRGDPHRAVFRTSIGEVECVELPPGTYHDLQSRAADTSLGGGVTARVAAPDDLAVQRTTSRDLVVAAGGSAQGAASSDGRAPQIDSRPRGRLLHVRTTVDDDDEYGPEPTPTGEGFFRRTLRTFEGLDRFLTDLNDGSEPRPRGRRR